MNYCDRSALEGRTREYWNEFDHGNIEPCTEWYITNLLPDEMACAEKRNALPTNESCDLLVFLVGHSMEPLLQSVWTYRPKRVLLILNHRYGRRMPGKMWGEMVARLITKLPYPLQIEEDSIINQSGPKEVFQCLLERIRQSEGVIVDITGAKKNMVAGAFLYAALADIPVSYVDSDDEAYDPEYRRPYGYGCRIGLLKNPYQTFALRDWERVRESYKCYKFRDAHSLLQGQHKDSGPDAILKTMARYRPESGEALQKVLKVLSCYESWNSGDYNEAAEIAGNIAGLEWPTAVEILGGKWCKAQNGKFIGGPPDFYEDNREFRAYVFDELARTRRLIEFNHDYRSAFLRAGSLNEVVMLARLVKSVQNHEEKKALLEAFQQRTPPAEILFIALRGSAGDVVKIGKKGDIWFSGAPNISVKLEKRMNPWWEKTILYTGEKGYKIFIDRRNDLTHKYFSPPLDWAEDAFAFVRANIEDLWGDSAGKAVNTDAIGWSELCRITGMEQHLPLNLTAD